MMEEERWAKVPNPCKRTALDGSQERRAMDNAPVYFSSDPYYAAFEERLDMQRYKTYGKPSGGMTFEAMNG